MGTIDQQFVEYVVKSLVGNPDDVKIERRIDEKGVLLELTVNPEDLGRVIGKRGATAQSLRTLLRALGTKNEARYNLKIIDNGERPPQREYDDRPAERNQDDNLNSAEEDKASETPEPKSEAKPSVEADDEIEQKLKAAEEAAKPEEDHASVLSKTRKELEELDDLEV